jgi:hypothetical protein
LAGRGEETVALWTDTRIPGETKLYWVRLPGSWPASDAGPLSGEAEGEHRAAVAADGDWILAVWEAWSEGGGKLRGAELPPSGPPRPVGCVAITREPGPVRRPACALRGNVGLLVWEDERDAPGNLYYARWDRNGGLRDPGGKPLAVGDPGSFRPRVAAGGNGFGAVWSEREGGTIGVRWQRFDGAGVTGTTSLLSTAAATDLAPDLAWSEDRWLLVWREGSAPGRIQAVFLDDGGVPSGAVFPVLPPAHDVLHVRAVGWAGGFWLAWQEHSLQGRELRRGLLDRMGKLHPGEGVRVAPPGEAAADPAMAVEGSLLRVVWRRPDAEDSDDLYMIRIPLDDTLSTPCPVPVSVLDPGILGGGRGEPAPGVALTVFPNPFVDRVSITVAEGERAVEIFDVRGRRLRRVVVERLRECTWDGRDERGTIVPPGVYFVRAGSASLRLVKVAVPE